MVTKDEIERLAYVLWEQEGRPAGHAERHYLEAERQLSQGNGGPAQAKPATVARKASTPRRKKAA